MAVQRRDLPRLSCAVVSLHTANESATNRRQSLASTILQAVAAAVILVQPTPAWAGEIIQGIPRVADGDTLQVQLLDL